MAKLQALAVQFQDNRRSAQEIVSPEVSRKPHIEVNYVNKQIQKCRRCEQRHDFKGHCKAREVECFKCKKMGHFGKFCLTKKTEVKVKKKWHKQVDEVCEEDDDDVERVLTICKVEPSIPQWKSKVGN